MGNQDGNGQEREGCSGAIVFWAFSALVLSVLLAFQMKPEDAGFWVRAALVLASVAGGVPGGSIGAAIGDALRKAAMPDAVFTNGGMADLLKTRLFWAIGPQSIGCLVGTGIGVVLTGGLLSKYVFAA